MDARFYSRKVGQDGMDFIRVAHERGRWRAVLNTVISLLVRKRAVSFE
jgi:hypothetical protein